MSGDERATRNDKSDSMCKTDVIECSCLLANILPHVQQGCM